MDRTAEPSLSEKRNCSKEGNLDHIVLPPSLEEVSQIVSSPYPVMIARLVMNYDPTSCGFSMSLYKDNVVKRKAIMVDGSKINKRSSRAPPSLDAYLGRILKDCHTGTTIKRSPPLIDVRTMFLLIRYRLNDNVSVEVVREKTTRYFLDACESLGSNALLASVPLIFLQVFRHSSHWKECGVC